jgi:hypothetical protein
MSNGFEMVAMTAIIANCIIMAMTHADMDATWRDLMTWANLSFTAFFTLEILLKFIALGFKPVLRVRGCGCAACTVNCHSAELLPACANQLVDPDCALRNSSIIVIVLISSVIQCLHCVAGLLVLVLLN